MKVHATSRDGEQTQLEYTNGESLMDILAQEDLVEATCGGSCSCATCQVYVQGDWLARLPPQDEFEAELLDALLNTNDSSRLACQIELTDALDGLSVVVAPAE